MGLFAVLTIWLCGYALGLATGQGEATNDKTGMITVFIVSVIPLMLANWYISTHLDD